MGLKNPGRWVGADVIKVYGREWRDIPISALGGQTEGKAGCIDLCPECLAEEDAVQADVQGYLEYRKAVGLGKLNYEEQKEYIAHRTEILENHRVENGITRQELALRRDARLSKSFSNEIPESDLPRRGAEGIKEDN